MSATVGAPTELAIHHVAGGRRMGFFTDTTVCIGCKACEVACKQWNDLPADGSEFKKGGSYDHTGELSASTWRPGSPRHAGPGRRSRSAGEPRCTVPSIRTRASWIVIPATSTPPWTSTS